MLGIEPFQLMPSSLYFSLHFTTLSLAYSSLILHPKKAVVTAFRISLDSLILSLSETSVTVMKIAKSPAVE